MVSLFIRKGNDGREYDATPGLANTYAGATPSPVWIVGGGPSLAKDPQACATINQSPIPKFGVNYGGRGDSSWLVKPDFWTSFDGSARFHKSIFLDPTIKKFVNKTRFQDLVPNTTYKVCDCPDTYFFGNEYRGYDDFFNPAAEKILHALDSFLQALDIAFRLGFRTFLCVGCELIVRPSREQANFARSKGVKYKNGCVTKKIRDGEAQSDMLRHFLEACVEAGIGTDTDKVAEVLSGLPREEQYSFPEVKDIRAAMNSDAHYWERVQHLRLSRRNMALNGVQLISATPRSRLNHWFPYESVESICQRYDLGVESEVLTEAYQKADVNTLELPWHTDVKPYGWDIKNQQKGGCQGCKGKQQPSPVMVAQEVKPDDGRELAAQAAKVNEIRIKGNEVEIVEAF